MSGPFSGAGGLDRWAAQARAKAERYQAMRAQAGQVSVTESSQDGLVTLTVDAAGNLTDLRITDRVKDMTGAQVSAAVLAILRRAQARLPERLAEVMAATIGDDQQTVDTIVGNYRAKFPEPEPDEPDPAPENVRRIGELADDEDEGWDGQSFMVRG